MVLMVDEHTFLDFSLIKESLACCANCVSDAVLLGSTVKICSAALFQCRVLAFSPERTPFSLSKCQEPDCRGVESTQSTQAGADAASLTHPLVADDTQIGLSRKRQTFSQIGNSFFFSSNVQYAERPSSVFE